RHADRPSPMPTSSPVFRGSRRYYPPSRNMKPDIVLELAWRHGLNDFAMPYLIQVLREFSLKVDSLEKANAERSAKEQE
ncbi:17963_t:CDS:2, partial [Entrophospora sp. SA101]